MLGLYIINIYIEKILKMYFCFFFNMFDRQENYLFGQYFVYFIYFYIYIGKRKQIIQV